MVLVALESSQLTKGEHVDKEGVQGQRLGGTLWKEEVEETELEVTL